MGAPIGEPELAMPVPFGPHWTERKEQVGRGEA